VCYEAVTNIAHKTKIVNDQSGIILYSGAV